MDLEKGKQQEGSSLAPTAFDGFANPLLFDFEYKQDNMVSEEDLPRIEREINHNIKKTEKRRQNIANGLRADGQPLVRAADAQQ